MHGHLSWPHRIFATASADSFAPNWAGSDPGRDPRLRFLNGFPNKRGYWTRMNRISRSWMFQRLIILIDLVGLISLASAIVGEFFPELIDGAGGPRAEFMFNVGVELFGAWVSIRFLDFLLRMREEHRNKRIGILRNLRWFLSATRGLRSYVSSDDIAHYRRERDWALGVFSRRQKYLSADEVQDCRAAYAAIEAVLEEAEEVRSGQEAVKQAQKSLDRALPWYHENAELRPVIDRIRAGVDQLRDLLREGNFEPTSVHAQIEEIGTNVDGSQLPPEMKKAAADHLALLRRLGESTSRLHANLNALEEAVGAAERNIREETPED